MTSTISVIEDNILAVVKSKAAQVATEREVRDIIMNVLHEGFGDDKFRPAPLLKKYVDAGLLGRKSGRGFYEYTK